MLRSATLAHTASALSDLNLGVAAIARPLESRTLASATTRKLSLDDALTAMITRPVVAEFIERRRECRKVMLSRCHGRVGAQGRRVARAPIDVGRRLNLPERAKLGSLPHLRRQRKEDREPRIHPQELSKIIGMETVLLRNGPLANISREAAPRAAGLGRYAAVGDAANVAAAFVRAAASADQPALIAGDQTVSYPALRTAVGQVQRYLQSRDDFRPGALVAIRLENSFEYLAALYGVLSADGVVVPLSPALPAPRWQQICHSCRPRWLITREGDVGPETAGQAAATLDLSRPPATAAEAPAPQRGGRDLAMVLYTSGSTGVPKGVMLSHRNLLANTQSILEYLPIRSDDRALAVLPFYHAFGNSILQTHMLIGATLVLGGQTTFPTSIIESLRQSQATSFSAVPEVFAMLVRFARLGDVPLPGLRYMSVAGGPLAAELAQHIARRIAPAQFFVMYGQTEATARLSYLPPEQLHRRWGSIGRGIPGVELRVVDDQGAAVGPWRIGRLLARGENVMRGYWEDPESTATLLSGGWLDTGDLATVDEDGYIYLRGRSSLLVKIQGHRVHPAEIEEVVSRRFPGVQAVVVPYEPGSGTRLALFVVPAGGAAVSLPEVRRACADELPRHKRPSEIEVLERWPLNDAMKVDRRALVQRLSSWERKAC